MKRSKISDRKFSSSQNFTMAHNNTFDNSDDDSGISHLHDLHIFVIRFDNHECLQQTRVVHNL